MVTDDPHDDRDVEYIEFEQGDETYEVRRFDNGALRCPLDDCQKIPDNERGLTLHLSMAHNRMARSTSVREECGEEFTHSDDEDMQFCSQGCAEDNRRMDDLATIACAYCDQEFEVLPSEEHRKYCSEFCFRRASRRSDVGTADD